MEQRLLETFFQEMQLLSIFEIKKCPKITKSTAAHWKLFAGDGFESRLWKKSRKTWKALALAQAIATLIERNGA